MLDNRSGGTIIAESVESEAGTLMLMLIWPRCETLDDALTYLETSIALIFSVFKLIGMNRLRLFLMVIKSRNHEQLKPSDCSLPRCPIGLMSRISFTL